MTSKFGNITLSYSADCFSFSQVLNLNFSSCFFFKKSDLTRGRVAYRPLDHNEKCDVKIIHQTCTMFGLDLEVCI